MTWIEGSVFDKLMDGETQLGTVMPQDNGHWFWQRYNPEGRGYEKSRLAARQRVESAV